VVQIAEPFDGTHKVYFLFFNHYFRLLLLSVSLPSRLTEHTRHTHSQKKKHLAEVALDKYMY
jgi:hypothetical protein